MAADPLDLERLEQRWQADEKYHLEEHGHAELDIARCIHRRCQLVIQSRALIAALRAEQARVREAETDRAKQAERISNLKWDMDCVAAQLDIRTREDLPTAVMRFQQQATKRAEVAESRLSDLQAEVRALREQVKGLEALRAALPERYHKGWPMIAGGDRDQYSPMVDHQWLEGVKKLLAALASPSSDAKGVKPNER